MLATPRVARAIRMREFLDRPAYSFLSKSCRHSDLHVMGALCITDLDVRRRLLGRVATIYAHDSFGLNIVMRSRSCHHSFFE